MQGQLQISVYERNEGKPCPNARIRVIDRKSSKVIEELITSDVGQTEIINVDAPPKELTLAPEQEEQPYSEVNIQVEALGFEPMVIEGAQIIADSLALQNVDLRRTGNPEVILVPAHTLWGLFPPKIPEEPIKPLPPPSGFVVLDKPVIPETIVVHDGVPDNTSSKNYYVPFKDYVKNVASCEIYSTWPEATIRSNVLAILSFTLNRVFTEWYRNKGKNFTITNSTAYDHAFIYGRNIFAEISRIVDDIFNTYITKPDIRQPLFTQYCDGKRTTCPNWLSQWGSKDLGDKGLSDIDILKTYYGPEIYLSQAEKVMGVPSSFPGTPLTVGSSGKDVTTIQKQLNVIAKNYPAIPKLIEDGRFGDRTLEAVKVFQGIFKIPQSGIVDFATWYKISDVYVAVAKLATL